MTTVDLNNPKPVFIQIVDLVRKAVATGALHPGDQLPTIREAAIQARVNRNTISRAYLELEHLGLVRTRQGSGCFVSENGLQMVKEEKLRIISKKVDDLMLEACHYRVDEEDVIRLIQKWNQELGRQSNTEVETEDN